MIPHCPECGHPGIHSLLNECREILVVFGEVNGEPVRCGCVTDPEAPPPPSGDDL